MIKNSLNLYFSPLNSQRGQSSVYVIIFIIVIIFAVMFSGGGGSLFSGNTPSSVTDAPSPTAGPTGITPTADNPISLTHTFLGCGSIGLPGISILAFGAKNGYMKVEIDNGSGGYDYYVGAEFTPPGKKYGVAILNSKGFNTKKWRIKLFSGGSVQNDQWQGGTEVASDNGDPTGCH